MSILGVGVIGCGNISTAYFRLAPLFRGIEMRACADLNAEVAKAQADAANQAKSTFLASMSHEIRTPMNGVLGMTEVLLRSNLDKEQREHTELLKKSADALLLLLNDILDLSKIESGQLTLERVNFNLSELLSDVLKMWMPVANEKNLDFSTEFPDDYNQFYMGDPARLKQIFNNLVSNALKFTDHGDVRIKVFVSNRNAEGESVKFEVHDSGIGIKKESQNKLFKKFIQAESDTTRKFGGTGLGLAICKQLVTAMGGNIGVASKIGVGTQFYFEVPFEFGQNQYVTSKEEALSAESLLIPAGLKVLLADDIAINRKIIEALLEPYNCTFCGVADGVEALDALKNESFDIVLMDSEMPIMNGLVATNEIRKMSYPVSDIPILAITANAMEGERKRYLENGFDGYVSKPVKLEVLLLEINRALKV